MLIGLSLYTLALLSRTVTDGLTSVQGQTTQAARALGYRPLRQLLGVELPMAAPVLFAGLRVATVANISLVSVGALVGSGGLGNLFTSGFQLGFIEPIIIGIVLSMLLAGVCDVGLVLLQRWLTPWSRIGASHEHRTPTPMIDYFGYLFDGANWHLSGDSSIPERLAQHVATRWPRC